MKNKKLKAQTLLEIAFKKNYKLMKKHITKHLYNFIKQTYKLIFVENYFCHPMGYSRALQNDKNTLP
jgi:hypothetical protein